MALSTFTIVPQVPEFPATQGSIGHIAYDYEYFYIYTNKGWKRTAFAGINTDIPNTIWQNHDMTNYVFATNNYFFVRIKTAWRNFSISAIDSRKINRGGPLFLVKPIYDFRLSSSPVINMRTNGAEGMVSYNSEYFYIFTAGAWRTRALSNF